MTEYASKTRRTPPPFASGPKTASPVTRHATASGGQMLDAKTQKTMEARFGHDFSQVRIHASSHAAASAQHLGAKAYTQGHDIVFGDGQFQPHSREGERLLAHELTHVVQQSRFGAGGEARVSRREDASEREAERAAEEILTGNTVGVMTAPATVIAREEEEGYNPFENPYLKWGGKALENIPGLGLLGGAIGTAGDAVGAMTGKSTGDRILSGAKAATGMGGMVAELGGFEGVLGGAGLFGEGGGVMSALTGGSLIGEGGALGILGGAATEGGLGGVAGTILPSLFGGATGAGVLPGVAGMEAFGAEGALAGAGLEGAAALGPAAAVAGAGLAGVGAGIGLDHLSNSIGQKITGDDKGDYSISNGLAHMMSGADNLFTSGMRAVGAYDDSKPEYTQTVGMQLANLFTPTTNAAGHEDSFTDRLSTLF